MSADMLTATIAVPADREPPIDFDRGRGLLEQIHDVSLFGFDDPQSQIEGLIDDFDPDTHLDENGSLVLEVAVQAGRRIIDVLEETLGSSETTEITVAGYRILISGGLSWGEAPTDAAEAIWNAYLLPETVLLAMGFIPDYTKPLSRTNQNPGRVTEVDVVDAIALGLGTRPEWSGADELDWIADTIAAVRPHPGDRDPHEYREEFAEQHTFDPTNDNFLNSFISEQAHEVSEAHEEAEDEG